jgi:hypothetical protein
MGAGEECVGLPEAKGVGGMKHTPGPWKVKRFTYPDSDGITRSDVIAPKRDDYIVAAPRPRETDEGYNIITYNAAMPQGEYDANARLITAAPDLLAACELLCDVYLNLAADYRVIDGVYLEAKAAIAKAKGEA